VLELAGHDEQALTVYAALLEANPTLYWVEDRQASILTRLKRYDEARALREKQLARSPGERQSYADLARIYTLQGREADYLTWLRSRLEKYPAEPTLQSVLLDEYAHRQRAPEGWAYLHEVMDRHQNDRKALEAYGDTLTGAGRAAEAADVWGRLARLNPKDLEIQTEYADRLTACGRQDEAIRVFQQQVARADISAASRTELRQLWAQRLEQQGKLGDAITQYREIVKAMPNNYEAIAALVRLFRVTNRNEELITTCLDLLKQSNYPAALRVQLFNALGASYEQLNNREVARQNYRQALLLDAKNRVATEGLRRVGTN
jgi:Flp pilus assembly protein TadD